jgi:predicted DNA-binding antitoxin AbrB/MazE fold protein
MNFTEAEFENGVLRPLSPLPLRPGERVRIAILRHSDPSRWDLERLAQESEEDITLANAGMEEWVKELEREDRR